MEAKFTKGDLKVIDVLDDSWQFSCPYPVDENNRSLFNRNSEEGRANAVLMTQAHKLYEAAATAKETGCEGTFGPIHDNKYNPDNGEPGFWIPLKQWERLCAALAKARGETLPEAA